LGVDVRCPLVENCNEIAQDHCNQYVRRVYLDVMRAIRGVTGCTSAPTPQLFI